MGSALDSQDGVATGWCRFCGCPSKRYKRSSGIPMTYHVNRRGQLISNRSRYGWWHNPEQLTYSWIKSLWLRLTFRIMDAYKRLTASHQNRRHRIS